MRVKKWMLCLLSAYVTLLGLKTDLCAPGSERSMIVQLFDAMTGFSVQDLILFAGIVCLYSASLSYLKRTGFRFRDVDFPNENSPKEVTEEGMETVSNAEQE